MRDELLSLWIMFNAREERTFEETAKFIKYCIKTYDITLSKLIRVIKDE